MGDKGAAAQAELEIHSHFAGKRDGERVEQKLEIVLRVGGLAFAAETVDISRSGVLLRFESGMTDADIDLPYFALQVQCYFADGCDAVLPDTDKPTRAEVVRVTEKEGVLLVAFRFDEPLPAEACQAMGIPSQQDDNADHAQE